MDGDSGGEKVAITKREQLAQNIANYVETHVCYADLTKREAVIEAVSVLTDDIGAAQQFVYAIGLEVDLTDYFDSNHPHPNPHDICFCGGQLDQHGICEDKCARDGYEHD